MNLYAKSEDIHKKIVMAVILTIWIIGIIIAVVHKMREWNKVKGYLMKGASKGDGVAERILERIHWKRKDLWKKFIINIIGMIFWWNPLAYLLCKDLDQIIELNCDNAMSKKYSEMDTLYYLDTLTYMAGGRRANFDEVSSNTLGFVKKLEVRPLKQRFHYVMFKKDDKRTQRKMNLFILGVSVIWFVASYYFILQPKYTMPQVEVYQEDASFVSDDGNSYLEEQKDGSYIFYYAGFTDTVSKEDVESGMYEGYPIIKYNKK